MLEITEDYLNIYVDKLILLVEIEKEVKEAEENFLRALKEEVENEVRSNSK